MKKHLSYLLLLLLLISTVLSSVLIVEQGKYIETTSEMIKQHNISDKEVLKIDYEARNIHVRDLIFLSFIEVMNLVSAGLILYHLLKHPARMTYEEYKEKAEIHRRARQAAHLERKRKALSEKLAKTEEAIQQTDKKS